MQVATTLADNKQIDKRTTMRNQNKSAALGLTKEPNMENVQITKDPILKMQIHVISWKVLKILSVNKYILL